MLMHIPLFPSAKCTAKCYVRILSYVALLAYADQAIEAAQDAEQHAASILWKQGEYI